MKNSLIASAIIAASMSSMAFADITICTGGKNGQYFANGKLLTRTLGDDITGKAITTKGSWANMKLVSKGVECNAAIVQADAWGLYGKQNPAKMSSLDRVGPLGTEYVHFLVNSKLDAVDDLADFESGEYTLATGKVGSGGWVFMQSIIAEDQGYKDVPMVAIGGLRAATKVADGSEIQGMIVIGGLPSGSVAKYDSKLTGLKLAEVEDDHDFNDAVDSKGNRLYEFAKIPSKTYPVNLQTGMFGSAVETLSMNSILVVNVDAMEEEEYEALLESYAMNLTAIQRK